MSEYTVETLSVTPYFDIEMIMSTSQETRIGGALMDRLAERWGRWLPELQARRIETDGQSYLAVWLGQTVEDEVDDLWEEAPSEAFLYNALAQSLCMSAVHGLLPEVEDAGCAPAPRPSPALDAALAAEGLPYLEDEGRQLVRRYAVTTYYPFKGACEICNLRPGCPKASGELQEGFSITLPGFEPDKE